MRFTFIAKHRDIWPVSWIADDVVHEGSYSPEERDHAERGRNAIVSAIFEANGEEGWAAKLEMAADPLCEHFKDRILAVAEEHWAGEVDAVALDDAQAVALDKTGEAPPATNEAMFAIMVDRLDDIDDLLLRDVSPREAWAGIAEERVMRREIARELGHSANGLYKIDQEAATVDEKETDVRLRSTISTHEAIIELKLADRRTARDLRDKVSLISTDEHRGYMRLKDSYPHGVVRHGRGEYVAGAIHTNTIEGFWSISKRGVVGTFHKVSAKYLPLYVAGFEFRYNNRLNDDIFGAAISAC